MDFQWQQGVSTPPSVPTCLGMTPRVRAPDSGEGPGPQPWQPCRGGQVLLCHCAAGLASDGAVGDARCEWPGALPAPSLARPEGHFHTKHTQTACALMPCPCMPVHQSRDSLLFSEVVQLLVSHLVPGRMHDIVSGSATVTSQKQMRLSGRLVLRSTSCTRLIQTDYSCTISTTHWHAE